MFDRRDVEDIILCMADIVKENRDLRYELERMCRLNQQYEQHVRDSVKSSEQANKEFLKMILEGALMRGNVND